MAKLSAIGFDADDTLWQNEQFYRLTEARFLDLLSDHGEKKVLADRLLEAEKRNLAFYGFGIKGFTLSMLEAAIEVTDGAIGVEEIGQLLAAGREMLDHPVELLDGVDAALRALADDGYRLVIVTKGDLHHQELKIARSGIAHRVERIEIVAEKDPATYRRVVEAMGVAPERFCMVGNSVRSDVLPVLEIGGRAVHIPYHLTWEAEHAEHDGSVPELTTIADLPAWLASLR